MSTTDAEQEALAAVVRYIAAINAHDTAAIRDTFNFPHARIGAMGKLSRFEQPEDYDFSHFYGRTSRDSWHHTQLDKTEIVLATDGKAHVAVDFTRYRADGSVIGHYFSLYVVTCQNGHWGIQFGSGNGS